jgi:diaminohydroxyphosphoribosylaminopyrimidine deaminase/5-amino-6-(5-phosphoribosylamino)uracil reductase
VTDRATDETHMAHALRLAARGLGNVWPNPAVGCVIVKDGLIVGRGWTQAGGRPHAEVRALQEAGPSATGATVYVTLEPCAHHGQTPPCAEALIAARVARVVTALTDPDPRVSGKGHALLRAAGIAITENVLGAEATRLNRGFLKRVTRGLPFLTLKLATTLDGRIATATGESRWITGNEARNHAHGMRLAHDAILVGSGTARADDPELSVRGYGPVRQPLRLLLDSQLTHAATSKLGQTAGQHDLWLLHGPKASAAARQSWSATGARLLECASDGDHLDLPAVFRMLASEGLTRILCEGGGQLAARLVKSDLVDELALYQAGCLIGADGTPAIGELDLTILKDAPRPQLSEARKLGPDLFSRWAF